MKKIIHIIPLRKLLMNKLDPENRIYLRIYCSKAGIKGTAGMSEVI